MSPLLIFLLVVLFLVGGLLVLRDTAFLRGKQKPAPGLPQRRVRRDHRQGDASVVTGIDASWQTDRDHHHDRHDNAADNSSGGSGGSASSGGDGGGGDGGGSD